jgi:nucleoside-diphosphate-sugar epimerase
MSIYDGCIFNLFIEIKMNKKKILVTGASGFIGYEVSRQLALDNFKPRLLIRRPLNELSIRSFDAEFSQGNLKDPKSLERAVRGVNAIIHLGARATFESYERLKPDILDGSLNLMRAAAEAGVKSFVYSSSLLLYGNQSSEVDEMTPAYPVLDYGRIKLETETRLSQMASAAGINFSSIRLPHVYGIMDLYFSKLRNGVLIQPGLGRNNFAHMHVKDAARILIACAEQGYNGISPVGDNLSAKWAEFTKTVRRYYPKARVVILPYWLAIIAAAMLTPFRRFRPNPGLETPGAVRSFNCNIPVKPGLVWQDIKLKPHFPTIYDGVPAVINELKSLS